MVSTDRHIAWKRQRLYIPAAQFVNGGAGALTIGALAGSPMYGIKESAVGTAREGIIKLPTHINPEFPLGFRVHWMSEAANLTSATFIILAIIKAADTALIAAATGALDTLIGATAATGGATIPHWSNRGIRNANFATRQQIHDGAVMQFSVELDAATGTIDGAANEFGILGLELDFVPMYTRLPHNDIDCPLTDLTI